MPFYHERLYRKKLLKYEHAKPTHPQLNPHKHRKIKYGTKQQLSPEEDTIPDINAVGVKRVQSIIGDLLYYACSVDNKLLVALSAIGPQKASATESTAADIKQILDYIATYPNDGISYCTSDMVLDVHYDTRFHNESKGRSCAGAHIFLSENDSDPRCNGPVLTISQIITFFMTSVAEA